MTQQKLGVKQLCLKYFADSLVILKEINISSTAVISETGALSPETFIHLLWRPPFSIKT